ncbi:MAG TPA: hypothetical protein VK601_28875 [Kofleriaceae bacterium]|nr:hypothetical protein [Kofleriaceae bacterium]
MQPPTRHDDLDELRQRKIAVPAVFRRGAWLSLALGQRGLELGPAATQLLLWLPVGAAAAGPGDAAAPSWAEVDAAIGARGAAASRAVPVAASALWEGAPGPQLTAAPDHWTVHGVEYPTGSAAFGNIFWKHGWALGTRAGLLVSLVSG